MKKLIKITSKYIHKTLDSNPRIFSGVATIVSVVGLALLIVAAASEKDRHLQESEMEENTKNGNGNGNINYVKTMNVRQYEINKTNTAGTILVFLGFFLQQIYNIIFRM